MHHLTVHHVALAVVNVVTVTHVVHMVHLVVAGRVRLRVAGASLALGPAALADLLWWWVVHGLTFAPAGALRVLEAAAPLLVADGSWDDGAAAIQANHARGDLAR